MTLISIDIANRFAAAFGLAESINRQKRIEIKKQKFKNRYDFVSYPAIDPEFESVKFSFNGNEFNFSALPFLKQKDVPVEYVLAPPPIISFTQQKELIETPVNESDNVVVERWGTNPWNIRIRGLLIDVENRHYPQDRIKKLYKLFKYNGVVEVSGTQFFEKEIASVYFKNIEINGIQGFQDTVQFTLEARSIAPVSFTLLNP